MTEFALTNAIVQYAIQGVTYTTWERLRREAGRFGHVVYAKVGLRLSFGYAPVGTDGIFVPSTNWSLLSGTLRIAQCFYEGRAGPNEGETTQRQGRNQTSPLWLETALPHQLLSEAGGHPLRGRSWHCVFLGLCVARKGGPYL